MSDITDRVARGAIMLDAKHPDWFHSINMDTFDITDVENCILGQLYGNYYTGRVKLFGVGNRYSEDEYNGSDYGINLTTFEWDDYKYDSDLYDFPQLYWEAWNDEVMKRKNV